MIVKTEKELREKVPAFDFKNPIVDPIKLKKELIDAMFDNAGLGISANQIGYKTRVFAMRGETKKDSIVCFNPEIVDFSPEMNTMEEGCLSLPDVFVRVVRPSHIATKYLDELQKEQGQLAEGLTARVYQHDLPSGTIDVGCFQEPNTTNLQFQTAHDNAVSQNLTAWQNGWLMFIMTYFAA